MEAGGRCECEWLGRACLRRLNFWLVRVLSGGRGKELPLAPQPRAKGHPNAWGSYAALRLLFKIAPSLWVALGACAKLESVTVCSEGFGIVQSDGIGGLSEIGFLSEQLET